MGSNFPGYRFLPLICLIALLAGFDYNVPQKLTDGVFVTGARVTNDHVATWTLVVVLDAPRADVTLQKKVQTLRAYIHSVLSSTPASHLAKWSWLQRLRITESQIPHSSPTRARRTRRSFFDLVGNVLNKVFGVATEAQVDVTKRWIQQVRVENQRILHKTNDLITVVNHTFAELQLNRKHIRDIEDYISQLHAQLVKWTSISTIAFERVRASLRIDQCLSALESVHLFWIRQLRRYRRQRVALESGLLTEDILPPTDLREILKNSRRTGLIGMVLRIRPHTTYVAG